ncbi:hypothetical protein ASPSYDRAFT_726062 [Aspergillus sydowii CBS 593.65]|uniref:Uncharacterized protein n=1 Tax=Aspergillus sydowii CBS 593.65 TaxID=1036612 RepID=A0A1L9SXT6_9EURO|nr:uncharacterized protein ASPSYDRAFT_726062 [Aspergillus sydowii CBS 593.65]OJJ51966.1 hypothetical protein ASPSYDRAFT_726062 [Aspergillus sydowii CBS 593.65]
MLSLDRNADFWQNNWSSSPYLAGQEDIGHLVASGMKHNPTQTACRRFWQCPIASPNPHDLNSGLLQEICGVIGIEQTESPLMNHSRHPRIKFGDLSQNDPQNIQFLRANGCFHIPLAPALVEIMRHYFV